jgi:Ca2+-dependent lipid-binding protein
MFTENQDLMPEIGALKENIQQIISDNTLNGKLIINLIHAKKLIRADIQGKADPYVKFILPNNSVIKSKAI